MVCTGSAKIASPAPEHGGLILETPVDLVYLLGMLACLSLVFCPHCGNSSCALFLEFVLASPHPPCFWTSLLQRTLF
jgi:hypothetical protein